MSKRRLDETAVKSEVLQVQQNATESAAAVSGRRPPTSERKIAANRNNAKKSTGPKTQRGKNFSRTNALKHGIFSRLPADFALLGENSEEYEALLGDLRDCHFPVGRAEEIEVERIAICLWRLKRAHRFENSSNRFSAESSRDVLIRAEERAQEIASKDMAVIGALEEALEKIERIGEVPLELKASFSSLGPGYSELWQQFEQSAQDLLNQEDLARHFSDFERRRFIAIRTVASCIAYRSRFSAHLVSDVRELILARHVIPGGEALEKLVRYETAAEKSLQRSQERLWKMQRRRTDQSGQKAPGHDYRFEV